jgi:hypothetical protein
MIKKPSLLRTELKLTKWCPLLIEFANNAKMMMGRSTLLMWVVLKKRGQSDVEQRTHGVKNYSVDEAS